ncbi:ABC transporter permease [Streptomyces sp. YIM 98790]|uniref:ABC transporter permease n=1 Tax=Streptomyces sp. YIM 98790 TaxID=2689077 RepID=UPI00140A6535
MSTELHTTPDPVQVRGKVERGGRRRLSYPVVLLIIAAGLLLLSLARVVTDTPSLTDARQWGSALGLAVPIGLAGLGGLWSERSGVINIGLEGMMMLGMFGAGWIGWQYGPWPAVLAGVIGGVLGALVHAVATVTFGVDHIVSGVAVNILALGVVQFLAHLWFGEGTEAGEQGGNDKQSPRMDPLGEMNIPGVSGWLADLKDQNLFLVSDTAGVLGALVSRVSWLTVIAVVLFIATYVVLWKTSFGLRLRSCGENPVATESLGVNVYLYKYIAVMVSGALAGLGGAYLAVFIRMYQDGQTGGRGFLGLATMIFGNWRPGGVAVGAGLFGFMDALQIRGGGDTVHAILLLFAVLLAAVAVWQTVRARRVTVASGVNAALAAVLLFWWSVTDTMPGELVTASPYITTLVVLTLFSQRLRVPRAIGKPYRRGQST